MKGLDDPHSYFMINCERYKPIRGFDFETNSVLKTSAAQRYRAPGARTQLSLASQRTAKRRGFSSIFFIFDMICFGWLLIRPLH